MTEKIKKNYEKTHEFDRKSRGRWEKVLLCGDLNARTEAKGGDLDEEGNDRKRERMR